MTTNLELLTNIKAGRATDDQLAEFIGPDLMIKWGVQWQPEIENAMTFIDWYNVVAKPLGVPRGAAKNLFYGRIRIKEFVAELSDDVLDAFLERFEDLQEDFRLKYCLWARTEPRRPKTLAPMGDSDRAAKTDQIVDSLGLELPQMQYPGLRHEFLASVANVFNHPVASAKNDDGSTRLIGFADPDRLLPLCLVVDSDGSVLRAFVPRLKKDRKLLKRLQRDENKWAREHDTEPRDLAGQIRRKGRRDTNLYGLLVDAPTPTYSLAQRMRERAEAWYDPRPMDLEHDSCGPECEKGAHGPEDEDRAEDGAPGHGQVLACVSIEFDDGSVMSLDDLEPDETPEP